MIYKTNLSGEVRAWHGHLDPAELERRIGRAATHKRRVGDAIGPRAQLARESYCAFEIIPKQVIGLSDAVTQCAMAARQLYDLFLETPSVSKRISIIIAVYDCEFIQLDLDSGALKALGDAHCDLSIENRSPS
jgi:hypothetical protein